MSDSIPLSRIIDSAGIAERHGITRQALSNWKQRLGDDFPAPLETPLCRGNPIYDVEVIDAWMEANTTISRTLRSPK